MRRRQRFIFKLGLLGAFGIFLFLLINNVLSPRSAIDNIIPETQVKLNDKIEKSNIIKHDIGNAQENRMVHSETNAIRRIDWHDYNAIKRDSQRRGLGEQGKKAFLQNHDRNREKLMYRQNGFNAMLSDAISLNRSVPDIRYFGCKKQKYLENLPKASIIFIFYNEHPSVLYRSIYSVLNRSPANLLKEIILVDDFSDRGSLKSDLDEYIARNFPRMVKVVRLNKRTGLIGARMAGARIATGDVLIFFDSHIETNYNWLPPLLEPIALNPKASVCPFIDVISHSDFEYRSQDEGARGAFDWQFYYKRLPLLPEDIIDRAKPFKSPVMAGGLFAIGSDFFWQLGGYDEGLDIWGGEQYELSFKIWMCGGELLDAPCSRVAHIYRGPMDARKNPRNTDYVHKNYKRVAEVWMDEYKEYLYAHDEGLYETIDVGDISKQLALRNNCKSFKWFMTNIAFDLVKVYPPIEPPDYAYGTLQSLDDEKYCVDTLNSGLHNAIGLYPCSDNHKHPQKNQYWALSWHRDLRIRNHKECLDVAESIQNAQPKLWECHGQGGNQFWFYDEHSKMVKHGSNLDRCLEADIKKRKLYINKCDQFKNTMKWQFGVVNSTALANFKKNDEEF